MNLDRFFHSGQKVILKVAVQKKTVSRFDILSGQVASCQDATLEIAFPPPYEQSADYPFTTDQQIEVLSERHGMGLNTRGRFLQRPETGGGITLALSGELNYFNRRQYQRVDTTLWIGQEHCLGSIAFLKGRWEQLSNHLRGDTPSPNLTDYSRQKVSLSGSGIGLNQAVLPKTGDYYLIFLGIDDGKPAIATLGQVVRTDPAGTMPFNTGIRFDCILEEDRQRIERLVKLTIRQQS